MSCNSMLCYILCLYWELQWEICANFSKAGHNDAWLWHRSLLGCWGSPDNAPVCRLGGLVCGFESHAGILRKSPVTVYQVYYACIQLPFSLDKIICLQPLRISSIWIGKIVNYVGHPRRKWTFVDFSVLFTAAKSCSFYDCTEHWERQGVKRSLQALYKPI